MALKKSNRILKKKTVLHEREIARFSKSLKRKDKELERKDKELNLERSMWNSRNADWDSGTSTDLHRIEVFDSVISEESSLHSETLRSTGEFKYILEHAKVYAMASGKMPLFYENESRASDPGNRCKLRLRHALLMALIHKKDSPAQGTLQAIFRVDQTSVCRYLHVMDRILAAVLPTAENVSKDIAECETKEEFKKRVLAAVLPTAENVSKDIAECETKEEFKKRVPGLGGGDLFVDGTHCRVQRPSEKTTRRMRYSGKKKTFTSNTNVYTNVNGVIIGISKSSAGSTGDITLLREDPMPFGKWEESMHDDSLPEEDRIRIWVDKGYLGTDKDLPDTNLMIPHKRSKNHRILTAEQKEHNHLINSTRVQVEHSIRRIKRYARMTDPYDGTIGEFNRELDVITGLVNLSLLWDKIDKGPPSPERWGTRIDWNGPVPPASGVPF